MIASLALVVVAVACCAVLVAVARVRCELERTLPVLATLEARNTAALRAAREAHDRASHLP